MKDNIDKPARAKAFIAIALIFAYVILCEM